MCFCLLQKKKKGYKPKKYNCQSSQRTFQGAIPPNRTLFPLTSLIKWCLSQIHLHSIWSPSSLYCTKEILMGIRLKQWLDFETGSAFSNSNAHDLKVWLLCLLPGLLTLSSSQVSLHGVSCWLLKWTESKASQSWQRFSPWRVTVHCIRVE